MSKLALKSTAFGVVLYLNRKKKFDASEFVPNKSVHT